jgi:hypothetical protein
VFHRDRDIFQREFPQWRIERITPIMPLRYLISGGVATRSLMPGFTTPLWRGIETLLGSRGGMFAHVVLSRL